MNKTFCISNHKGGVGKTTTTVNLSAALATMEKRILAIDFDPQANLTHSFGVNEFDKSVYDALKEGIELPIIPINEYLDIVPSCIDLSAAETELINEPGKEYILKELISKVKSKYDYILIDCPPSLGFLTINAFTASEYIIIPLQAHYLAMQGLSKMLEIIEKVKNRLNPDIEIGGIILTYYDERKILNKDVHATIEEHFDEKVFFSKIRENIALAEAPSSGTDIITYSPKSNGANDYKQLCTEFYLRFDS